jgi:hypothetical protein
MAYDANLMYLLAGFVNMAKSAGSAVLPDFPGEDPHPVERRDWVKSVTTVLAGSDALAYMRGKTPPSLIDVAEAAGNTELGARIEDGDDPCKARTFNQKIADGERRERVRKQTYDDGEAAISSRLAAMLSLSLTPVAPCLLADLEERHGTKTSAGYWTYDGKAMWLELERDPGPGGPTREYSEEFHLNAFEQMRKDRLPNGTLMGDYAAKCMLLKTKHLDFLPAHITLKGAALSNVYFSFLPPNCDIEARASRRVLEAAAEWGKPEVVLRAMQKVADMYADREAADARLAAAILPVGARRDAAMALAMVPRPAAALASSPVKGGQDVPAKRAAGDRRPAAAGDNPKKASGKAAAAQRQAERYLPG